MSLVHLLLPAGDRWIGYWVNPEHAELKTIGEVLAKKYNPNHEKRATGFWFKCDDCKQCVQEVLRKENKAQNCFANQKVTVCYRCHRIRKDLERSARG